MSTSFLLTQPLYLLAGESRVLRVTVEDETGARINLTGATIEFQVKAALGGADPALISKFVSSGITILPQSGETVGQADIELLSEDTAALSGTYYYDVVVVIGGARSYIIVPSKFFVSKVVNQPDAVLPPPVGAFPAAVLEHEGQTLVLPPGTYALDLSIPSSNAYVAMQHGAIITIPALASLGAQVGFSQGGLIRPANGIVLSLTGRLSLPPNHHAFDVSLGGIFQIAQTCIDRLTYYNFGAKGNNGSFTGTAQERADAIADCLAVRAWLIACQWSGGDALGNILAYAPPGRCAIGLIMDEDERGDYVHHRLNKTGAKLSGAAQRVSSFKFNPAPAWAGSTAYPAKSLVSNGGNLYKTTAGGVSAASGGPTGTGASITDGTVTWSYVAADSVSRRYICTRIEEQPVTEPSLYQTIENHYYSANGDTTHRKVAIDGHDVRRMKLDKIAIEVWSDASKATGEGSVGVLTRGRDASVIIDPFIDADSPIVIAQNDDETEPLDGNGQPTEHRDDSEKDDDHKTIVRPVINADNVYGAAIRITPGTVVRNLEIEGDWTSVDGSILTCIDRLDSGGVPWAGAEVPTRRRSNTWYIGRGRIEGTLTRPAINIERYHNAKLQELIIDGPLLAEGYDCRRNALVGGTTGLSGGSWPGIVALGVRRVIIKSGTRYNGSLVPLLVDAGCEVIIEPGAELVPTEHKRRWPEHSSHLDFIRDRMGHPNFAGLDHWYSVFEGSGTHASYSGSFPLGRAGSVDPLVQQLLDDWDRYWLGFTNVGGQRVQVGVVDAALAAASHSKLFGCVVRIDPTWTPGAITQILNMAGDSNGPAVRLDTAGKPFMAANGLSGTATAMNLLDGVPALITAAHNRNAGTLTGLVTKFSGSSRREAFSGTYFAAPSNLAAQGWGAISGIDSFKGLLGLPMIVLDTKAEQSQAALHDALGWVE